MPQVELSDLWWDTSFQLKSLGCYYGGGGEWWELPIEGKTFTLAAKDEKMPIGRKLENLYVFMPLCSEVWGLAQKLSWYEDYFKLKIFDINRFKERSLLRASFILLKATTSEEWCCHQFFLWGWAYSQEEADSKSTINHLSRGISRPWRRWKHYLHLHK